MLLNARLTAAVAVSTILALVPAASATAEDSEETTLQSLVLVTPDGRRDQTPVDWHRDFSRNALSSSDITRVRYEVN